MNALSNWFSARKTESNRIGSLHALVFGHGSLGYATYRLRYFFLILIVRTALHTVEFLLLSHVFSGQNLVWATLLRLLSIFAESGWWGTLDIMRRRVKQLKIGSSLLEVQKEISLWLSVSIFLGGLIALAAPVSIFYYLSGHSPLYLFAAAIAVQTAFKIVSRTFYSGAYAISRVFFPFSAILVVELVIFGFFFLLKEPLGIWAAPSSLLLSTFISTLITYRYVRMTSDFLRITPQRLMLNKRIFSTIASRIDKAFVWAGLASILIRASDLFLFFLLLSITRHMPNSEYALTLLYILSPILRACSSWSQLFYFDMVKNDLDIFHHFREQFRRMLVFSSGTIAFLCWVLSLLLVGFFIPQTPYSLLGYFLPYYVLHSYAGMLQLHYFSQQQYKRVALASIIYYILALPAFFTNSFDAAFLYLLPALIIAILFLHRSKLFAAPQPSFQLLPLPFWMRLLKAEHRPIQLTYLHFSNMTTPGKLQKIIQRIEKRLHGTGHITMTTPHSALYYEHTGAIMEKNSLIEEGMGYIQSIEKIEAAANGEEALRQGIEKQFFSALDSPNLTLEALLEQFSTLFPDGTAFKPGSAPKSFYKQLQDHEKRSIIAEAKLFINPLTKRAGKTHLFISSLFFDEHIRYIFVTPRNAENNEERRIWRSLLQTANLQLALK